MTDSMSELPPPPNARKSSAPALAVYILAWLLLVVIVTAGAYYFWQQQEELADRLDAQSSKLGSLQTTQTGNLNRLERHVERLKSTSETLVQQVQKSLEDQAFHAQKLAQLGGGNRSDWLLAEAEYLLRLANQRLLLEHDIKGSELVLSAADSVLQEIDDPALLPARVALAEEILALQTLPNSDIQGAYARISSLTRAVDTLPEKFAPSEITTPEMQDTGSSSQQEQGKLWNQLMSELKKSLVIRREGEAVTPLMRPEEYYYLKHNLRLMYEQSVLALLARDEDIFKDSLAKAQDWLKRYFDTQHPSVAAQLETLGALSQISLKVELPDISRSLKLVKARIEALYRNHTLDKETPAQDKITEAPAQ